VKDISQIVEQGRMSGGALPHAEEVSFEGRGYFAAPYDEKVLVVGLVSGLGPVEGSGYHDLTVDDGELVMHETGVVIVPYFDSCGLQALIGSLVRVLIALENDKDFDAPPFGEDQ
jgi:hypothetical protein